MRNIHSTRRECERLLATKGDSERNVATPWDRRDSERQPVTIGDNERHAATTWHWERQPATILDNNRYAATPWNWEGVVKAGSKYMRQRKTCSNSMGL